MHYHELYVTCCDAKYLLYNQLHHDITIYVSYCPTVIVNPTPAESTMATFTHSS